MRTMRKQFPVTWLTSGRFSAPGPGGVNKWKKMAALVEGQEQHWRALNRESESSGSQPVYRKLFPRGPHSSKNNFFEIKISQPTPLDSLSVLLFIHSVPTVPLFIWMAFDISYDVIYRNLC